MKKRILGISLAVLMIASLLPMPALATDGTDMERPQFVSAAGMAASRNYVQIGTASATDVQNVAVVFRHPAMQESAAGSAQLTLAYSFEPIGCTAKAVERTRAYATKSADGSVSTQITVVKDESGAVATGIYTMTATVSLGAESASCNCSLEIIPEGAAVRYEYDTSSFVGDPESERADFRYAFNKESGYFSAFRDAALYCKTHRGAKLTLLRDDIAFESTANDAIGNDVILDANGHLIGSTDYWLTVNGRAYLANLTGTVYLRTYSYITTDIEVMNLLDDFKGVVLKPDQNFAARSSSRPLLSFNDETHGAQNVAIFLAGYTAVDVNGGIAIEKSTDRPFAVLAGDSPETYRFICFKSLQEAYRSAAQGDGYVYVLSYVNLVEGSNTTRNLYHYVGSISEELYGKLRTFVRITNGTKSDFYTVENDELSFKYTNMPDAEALLVPDVDKKATLNIPSELTASRDDGNVAITNDWTLLSTNTDVPIDAAGAYVINGAYEIDVNYAPTRFATAKKMAFYSKDSGAVLHLTGANMSGGSKTVDADIYGEYAEISVNKAIANIGTSVDYEGKCGTKKLTVTNTGFAIAGNEKTDVELGTVEIGANAFLSGVRTSLKSDVRADGNRAALTIADTAFVNLQGSRIETVGSSGETSALYGIDNNGVLHISGGNMSVAGNGQDGTICGISNKGTVVLGSDAAGNGFTLEMAEGTGICSVGESSSLEMSAADIRMAGKDTVGIDVKGGSFCVRSGSYEYQPQDTKHPGVSVAAGDTALQVADGVQWEISGSRNDVCFRGGNYAVDSASATPLSGIVDFNMSYGRYYGGIRIQNKTGAEAVQSVIPILNFYVAKNSDGSISIRNAEGELRNFLTANTVKKSEYTLPCFIYLNFYQSSVFGCLFPDGSKAITIGQGEHVLHFSENPYSSTQISRCIIVDEAEDSCVIDIPKGAALTFDGGSWVNQGIVVSAPTTLLNLRGGTFRNGRSGKGNGVFLSTGIYGEVFTASDLQAQNLKEVEITELNDTILNRGGYCELNGGLYDSIILNDGGNTVINDGAICAIAGETYYGSGRGKLTVNDAKFYGYGHPSDMLPWPAVFSVNASLTKRSIVGQKPGDNTVIPFGSKIQVEGSDVDWQAGDQLKLVETSPLFSLQLAPDSIFTVTAPPAPQPSAPVITDVETLPFTDVAEDAYYADAVRWAYRNGVTDGRDETHFSPADPVKRAEVVTFLWRAAGKPVPAGDAGKFADVKPGSYYEKAVAWAIEQGITNGTGETTFSPDAVCTRSEIVTFLARFAGVKDTETESVFDDVQPTDYYASAVKWAKDSGVTNGTGETTFSPKAACVRADAVTFLYRWMSR